MGATTSLQTLKKIDYRYSLSSSKKVSSGAQSEAPRTIPNDRLHLSVDAGSGLGAASERTSEEILTLLNDNYEFKHLIGKGASAQVFLVEKKSSREQFACKVIRKDSRMNDISTLRTELFVLTHSKHDNIIALEEVFETNSHLYLILELMEGDLIEALDSLPAYNEKSIAELFAQIVRGTAHLHSLGVVHRDLKIDNLLYVRKNGKVIVKITDFGLSAVTGIQIDSNTVEIKKLNMLSELWGTSEYFAPEVYERAYAFQADVWALGCVLVEMLTGELAFPVREMKESVLDRVLLNGGKKNPRRFELTEAYLALSSEARHLIKGMLKRKAVKRFSLHQALMSDWLVFGATTSISCDQVLVQAKSTVRARAERRMKRWEMALKEIEREKAYEEARLKLLQQASGIQRSS